jgi:cell division transport system permease protein
MARSERINEIPFEKESAPRYATWIIGFMTFLLGLALVAATALGNPFRDSLFPTANIRMTVEIPPTKDTSPVPGILQALQSVPGIASATLVDPVMLTQLLEPWVGHAELLKDLSVPSLIDIEVKPDANMSASELAQYLRSHAAGIRVEEHGPWQRSITLFQQIIQLLTYSVTIMIIGIVLATVTLVTRSATTTFHSTIDLLHMLGANRKYMSRQFLSQISFMGIKGSLIGFLVSIPGIVGARWAIGRLGVPDIMGSLSDADVIALLIAAPLIVSFLTIVVSRSVLARILTRLNYA